jgi:hypothetical protein
MKLPVTNNGLPPKPPIGGRPLCCPPLKCLFQFDNTSLIGELPRNFRCVLSLAQRTSAFYATSAAMPGTSIGTLSETAYQTPLNDTTAPYVTKEPLGRAG